MNRIDLISSVARACVSSSRRGSLLTSIKREYFSWRIRNSAVKCGEGLKVNGFSSIGGNVTLGDNVHFNGMQIVGRGKVIIGNNFHSGPGCMMICQIHNYDEGEALPYDATYIPKDIIIEDNVWLGARVIILGGVNIGEGAIIQAGSCVVGDIPKCAIAGGHPATVFKRRNIEHYERLNVDSNRRK